MSRFVSALRSFSALMASETSLLPFHACSVSFADPGKLKTSARLFVWFFLSSTSMTAL